MAPIPVTPAVVAAASHVPAGGPVGGQLTQRPSAVSPDGTRLYLCSGDSVRSFCTATGAPLGPPLLGHTGDVTGVGFHPAHPGGQVVLTASLDGTLRTWHAADGSPGLVLPAPGPVESMAVPGGKSQHGRDVVFVSCWKHRGGGEGEQSQEGGRVHAYSLG